MSTRMVNVLADLVLESLVLGPRFLLRHVAGAWRSSFVEFELPGYGRVAVRPGTSDGVVFRQVFIRKEYELPKAHAERLKTAYDGMLARGVTPVIIDAGANIGAASIWFGSLFPAARVLAIEPERCNADLCLRNTAANQNIRVIQAALAGEEGRVSIANEGAEAWAIRTVMNDSGEIAATTIGGLLRAQGPGSELLIVKIDIEGFEKDVFEGDVAWLEQTKALFVEPHDWMLPGQYTSRNFQQAMFSRGFELLVVGENLVFVR
ncbi:MAG TPA: FkbM family methyltransferase [Steroidobacteraceae bacterium]|nr:FkbM family methyltransferase [Steroidobacteraceae bacterium]